METFSALLAIWGGGGGGGGEFPGHQWIPLTKPSDVEL